ACLRGAAVAAPGALRGGRGGVGGGGGRVGAADGLSPVGCPIPAFPRKRGKEQVVAIQQADEGAGGGVSTGGSRGSDRLPPPRAGEGWGWGRVMSVQLMGCRLWAAPIPAFPRKRGRGRWWRFNRRQQGQVFGEQEGPHLAGLLSGHANRDQSRAASSASAAASFTAPAASAAASRVASAAWSAACSASAAA